MYIQQEVDLIGLRYSYDITVVQYCHRRYHTCIEHTNSGMNARENVEGKTQGILCTRVDLAEWYVLSR